MMNEYNLYSDVPNTLDVMCEKVELKLPRIGDAWKLRFYGSLTMKRVKRGKRLTKGKSGRIRMGWSFNLTDS